MNVRLLPGNAPRARAVAFGAALAASLAVSACYVFMGAGNWTFADAFFYLERFSDYARFPMSIGTLALGAWWTAIAGHTLLTTRLLAWFLCLAALFTPWLALVPRDERLRRGNWLCAGLLLLGYGSFAEYSSGTTTLFAFSLSATLAVRYWKRPHPARLFALTAVTALGVLFRFPNILTLPVAPALALAAECRNGKPGRGLISALLCAFLILLLYYLGLCALAGQWATPSWMTGALSQSATGSHSLRTIASLLLKEGSRLLIIASALTGVAWITGHDGAERLPRPAHAVAYGMMASGAALILYLVYWNEPYDWYNRTLHLTQGTAVILLMAVPLTRALRDRRWNDTVAPLILLYYCMASPIGSDTGWLKLFPLTVCLLPVAATATGAAEWTLARRALVAAFTIVSVHTYWCNPLDYTTLAEQTEPARVPLLQGLRISPERNAWFDTLAADYDTYGTPEGTLAYGQRSPILHCLAGRTYQDLHWPFYFNYDSPDAVNLYLSALPGTELPVVFLFEEVWWIPEERKRDNALRRALLKHGYRPAVRRSDYEVLLPSDNEPEQE